MEALQGREKIFFIAVSIVFILLNFLTPLTLSDDILYHCIWQPNETDPKLPLENLAEIAKSQYVHYQVMNGRVWIHTIIQLFTGFLGKPLYNVLQGFFFYALIGLMVRFTSTATTSLWNYVLVVFSLFMLIPGFADAFLFFVAGVNYLWVSVVVLIFLYRFKKSDKTSFSWITATLAFLSGWSHEGIALPLACSFVLYWFVNRKQLRRNCKLLYILIFLVGCALCIYPPLTLDRADLGKMNESGYLKLHLLKMIAILKQARLIFIITLMVVYLWWRKRQILIEWWRRQCFLFVAFGAAFGLAILSGSPSTRTIFYSEWLALLLLLDLVFHFEMKCKPVLMLLMAISMLIVLIPTLFLSLKNYQNYQNILEQCQAKGCNTVWVRQIAKSENIFMNYIFKNYVRESIRFGTNEKAQGFDESNEYVRSAKMLFHKTSLRFLPATLHAGIKADTAAQVQQLVNENKELMAIRLPKYKEISELTLKLYNENPDTLSFKERILAYKQNEYAIKTDQFKVIDIEGRTYLVFCLPQKNVLRRIKEVEWK